MTTSKTRMTLVLAALCAWPVAARAQSTDLGDPSGAGSDAAGAQAAPASEVAPPPRDDRQGPPPREPERPRRHRAEDSSNREFDLLWVGAEVGLSVVDLKMVSYDDLLPSEVDVRETGLGFGAAAGIRVKFLSAGLHLAVGQFKEFDVWAINLDGQLRIPLGALEPYLRVGLGYAFLGAFSGQVDMEGVSVDGWDLQAGFGLDLYPSDFLSLGAGADFTILNLTRTESITSVDLLQDGAAVGLAVFVQAKAALHF